jgi:hypothetical protein
LAIGKAWGLRRTVIHLVDGRTGHYVLALYFYRLSSLSKGGLHCALDIIILFFEFVLLFRRFYVARKLRELLMLSLLKSDWLWGYSRDRFFPLYCIYSMKGKRSGKGCW